ncbi:hypothetical protein JXO52_03685 [bacterium]|nr:hypothetical protein [bacterium]
MNGRRRLIVTAAIWSLWSIALYGQTGWQWRIGDVQLLPGDPPALQAGIQLLNGTGADTLRLGHHTLAGLFSADLYDFGENHDPEIAACGLDSFSVSLTDGPAPFDLQWNAVCDGRPALIPESGRTVCSLKLYIRDTGGSSDLTFLPLPQTFSGEGSPLDVTYDASGGSVLLDTTNMAVEPPPRAPATYALHPNYPNPFNPGTTITYDIPHAGYTELAVITIQGRILRTLFSGTRQPGSYTQFWDGLTDSGEPAAAGVLLLRLRSGRCHICRKMLLLK